MRTNGNNNRLASRRVTCLTSGSVFQLGPAPGLMVVCSKIRYERQAREPYLRWQMKCFATLVWIFFLRATSFGQPYPQALVDSFCNVTIEYYYTDYVKAMDSVEYQAYMPAFILKSELTSNLKSKFTDFTVRYVTHHEALEEFVKRENKSGSLAKLFVTQLQDTINIDIGGWSVRVTKVKFKKGKPIAVRSNSAVSCGGTLGYIPTCRFIYDRTTETWTRQTDREIANERMKVMRIDDEE